MAEYNYGINIPQPNTGMFGGNLIQGLSAIEGLRAAQAQREQAAALAPYQLQEAQLAIKAREQQMAQSAAAAARAARGEARAEDAYRMQLKAAESEIARRERVATVMNEFATNENAGADVLGGIIGLTNENERKALTDAARIRTGRLFKKMDPNNPDPESVQQIAELNALLPVDEAKRFDNILSAMPNKYRDGVVNTIVEASMFGLAKDNERAFGVLNDQIEALNKDQNPVSKRMAKELEEVVNRLPEDATPAIWANIGYMNQSKTDQKKAEGYLNFLKERAPESLAEKEAGTEAKQAETNLKKFELQLKQEGGLDPDKKRSTEIQMAQSFEAESLVRSYVLRRDIAQGIRSALDLETSSGDASAITNLVKIDDPTSTVSITEAGRISGGNLPEQFKGLVSELQGRGRLSEKTRNDVLRLARERMKTSQSEYDKYRDSTKKIAERYGLDPQNIFALPSESLDSLLQPKKKQTPAEIRAGKSIPPAIPTQQTGTAGGFNYKFREK